MFSTISKTEIIIWATFILSSANAFNLVMSKILSYGKELTQSAEAPSDIHLYCTLPEREDFEKHWEKQEVSVTTFFFKNVFYPAKEKFKHYVLISCFLRMVSVWESANISEFSTD